MTKCEYPRCNRDATVAVVFPERVMGHDGIALCDSHYAVMEEECPTMPAGTPDAIEVLEVELA